MLWWSKKNGDSQKENSSVNYERKYKSLRKKYRKLSKDIPAVKAYIKQILEEQNVASFLLFSIVSKSGGRLELTNNDIAVAEKLKSEHMLDMIETPESLIYTIKRKENEQHPSL